MTDLIPDRNSDFKLTTELYLMLRSRIQGALFTCTSTLLYLHGMVPVQRDICNLYKICH